MSNGTSKNRSSLFRNALIRHLIESETTIPKIARQTGVSKDLLNKLKQKKASTTSVENAILIANYFGKTVEEFILSEESEIDYIMSEFREISTDKLIQIHLIISTELGDRRI